MCKVRRDGNTLYIDVTASGAHADLLVLNYGGVGFVMVGMEPAMWPIRRELREFPGLLQMVRAFEPAIRCLKLNTES